MVKISPPPPESANPVFQELPIGTRLLRIFDPTRYKTQALTFRYHGRFSRFDHHRVCGQADPERGIYYAAFSLEGSLVEVFGDIRVVEFTGQELAFITLIRPLNLIDLRSSGAMMAGSVLALSMTDDRNMSQKWSSYFYETYPHIDGILYSNAHNGLDCVALYERSQNSLKCENIFPLNDYRLRPHIQSAALKNNLKMNIF